MTRMPLAFVIAAVGGLAAGPAAAHGIEAESGNAGETNDIVVAEVTAKQHWLEFRMTVADGIGDDRPEPTGELDGAKVASYVWPTKLDTARVGFGENAGILALAVTSHPDFDDTPLYDENGDGKRGNDGASWHTHWVVLVKAEDACGGGFKVKDIPEDATPDLPTTWPGLPLYIDSPGYDPIMGDETVTVRVPFRNAPELKGVGFDGVTAGLQVSTDVHDPMLCVSDVHDIASGDLSLPGKVE